jgi:3',5'-cyclic AMP phosphodiesterase CpdA
MKILVFADVHYYGGNMETAIFSKTKKLVQYALPMLDTLREKVCAACAPDICVNLGDIIQDTQSHDGDVQALAMMAEKLRAFPCPCYSLLGNHDMKMMHSRREAEVLLGLDSAVFSVDRDGMHLVFLTTGLWPERGPERGGIIRSHEMTEEDLAWLKADLAKNTLPVLVFTHYPLAEDPSVCDECMFMKNRAAVKEILGEDPHVRAVFSGHQHRTKTIVERGIPYFVLGSMTASPAENGIPDGVYLCVEADADTVRVTTHSMQI